MEEVVKETEEYFGASDGFKLSYMRWNAAGQAERALVCIHGTGDYSGVFRLMASDLANEGTEVYALDLRGLGNSREEGLPMGDTKDFRRHLQDLHEFVGFVASKNPGKKIFMMGHSLGCDYTLWYAVNHPGSLHGIILAAPAIKVALNISPIGYLKVTLLFVFSPGSPFDIYATYPKDFVDTEEFRIRLEDPLVARMLSVRYAMNTLTTLVRKALKHASRIEIPTLILQGDADSVALPDGARRLFEKIAAKEKKLEVFPGANHMLYGSLLPKFISTDVPGKRKQVTSLISDWLKAL